MTKTPSHERKQKIAELIEEVGLWNVKPYHLAPQFGVTRQQIEKDIKIVLREIPPDNIEDVKFNLLKAHKKATKEMHKILASGSIPEKTKAAQTLAQLGKHYTELLENYGLKEKVADKIMHEGEIKLPLKALKDYFDDETNK